VVLELSVLREAQARPNDRSFAGAVLGALRNALLHPVPLPIVAGLAWGQTGWAIPALVDKPLQLLGSAVGPMSLLMVGLSLSHAPLGRHVRGVLGLVAAKNLLMPALVAGIGLALGVRGLPLMVVVAVAGLPAGANTFLFSQRYQVAEEEVTTAVGVSTLLALLTVPVVMALAAML
jgi:predicted permease